MNCQLRQSFFGLTAKYKYNLHRDLVFMTMNIDGFTYTEWYNMPVQQRELYVKFAHEVSEERKKQLEKK